MRYGRRNTARRRRRTTPFGVLINLDAGCLKVEIIVRKDKR